MGLWKYKYFCLTASWEFLLRPSPPHTSEPEMQTDPILPHQMRSSHTRHVPPQQNYLEDTAQLMRSARAEQDLLSPSAAITTALTNWI